MGTYAGTKFIRDSNLKLMFDAKSKTNGINPYNRNQINWAPWVTGSVSYAPYYQNGDGNSRILDTTPYGDQDIVWNVSNQDATSDADGGWDNSSIPIDPTKTYRFSTWMKRKTIGNGYFYLGPHGINSSFTNEGVLNRSTGTLTTNPYFVAALWSSIADSGGGQANKWYYIVGHVWAAGSGTGAVHTNTGIYTADGTKLQSLTDYVWQSTNAYTYHRSYLYYSTDTSTNQQWYQPRLEVVDGNELPLSYIFANRKEYFTSTFDDSGNKNHGELINGAVSNGSTLTLDGTNDYATFRDVDDMSTFTVEVWFKLNALPGASTIGAVITNMYPGATSKINYYLGFYGTTNTLYGGFYDGTTWRLAGPITVASSTWYHMAVTYDGATIKIYKNGALTSSLSHTGTPASSRGGVILGKHYQTSSDYINAEIPVAKIYNRAMTDGEINQNFVALRGRYGL